MVSVKVKEGEPFEKALRRFKKKWEKAGILREFKSRTYYLKPSELKRIAKTKLLYETVIIPYETVIRKQEVLKPKISPSK